MPVAAIPRQALLPFAGNAREGQRLVCAVRFALIRLLCRRNTASALDCGFHRRRSFDRPKDETRTSWSSTDLQSLRDSGRLILGWASRLDAFSGYPVRT